MIVLLLGGCLTYADGKAQEGTLNCQIMDACGTLEKVGYTDVDDCIAAAQGQAYDENQCPNYSAEREQECLDAYTAALNAKECEPALDECGTVCG